MILNTKLDVTPVSAKPFVTMSLNELDSYKELNTLNESVVAVMNDIKTLGVKDIESYRSYLQDINVFFDRKLAFVKMVFRQNYMILQTLKKKSVDIISKIDLVSKSYDLKIAKFDQLRHSNIPNYKYANDYVVRNGSSFETLSNTLQQNENVLTQNVMRGKVLDTGALDSDAFYEKLEKIVRYDIQTFKLDADSVNELIQNINLTELSAKDLNEITNVIELVKGYFKSLALITVENLTNETKKIVSMSDKYFALYKFTDYKFRQMSLLVSLLLDCFNYKNTKVYDSLYYTMKSVSMIIEQPIQESSSTSVNRIIGNYRQLISNNNHKLNESEIISNSFKLEDVKKNNYDTFTSIDDFVTKINKELEYGLARLNDNNKINRVITGKFDLVNYRYDEGWLIDTRKFKQSHLYKFFSSPCLNLAQSYETNINSIKSYLNKYNDSLDNYNEWITMKGSIPVYSTFRDNINLLNQFIEQLPDLINVIKMECKFVQTTIELLKSHINELGDCDTVSLYNNNFASILLFAGISRLNAVREEILELIDNADLDEDKKSSLRNDAVYNDGYCTFFNMPEGVLPDNVRNAILSKTLLRQAIADTITERNGLTAVEAIDSYQLRESSDGNVPQEVLNLDAIMDAILYITKFTVMILLKIDALTELVYDL